MTGRGWSLGKDYSYSLMAISSSISFSFGVGCSLNLYLGFRVNWISSLLCGDLTLLSWLSVKLRDMAGWSKFYFTIEGYFTPFYYSLILINSSGLFYAISGSFLKNLLTALFFCFFSATISFKVWASDFPWVGSRIRESIIWCLDDWNAFMSLSVRTSLRFSLTWERLYYSTN